MTIRHISDLSPLPTIANLLLYLINVVHMVIISHYINKSVSISIQYRIREMSVWCSFD